MAPSDGCLENQLVIDWSRMVEECGPSVFRVAWHILGQAEDAEDVVQEVFLEAFQVAPGAHIRHWNGFLRRLATCRALDRLRRRKSTLPLDGRIPGAAAHEPEENLIGRELADRLRKALGRLPEREAEVFCLHYFEDLDNPAIAETLGIRAGAARAALHKARVKLERLLGETQGDHSCERRES
jgi:RNA polymerase sigma-70 factor (ECF subfamily)